MNRAEEDYVKTIYIHTIEKNNTLVKLQDLSASLNVTIQTAHEMVKKLEKNKLLKYLPYKGVKLTLLGKKEAERLIRAHRILEVFLTKTLNFNWAEVHQDAELLEHAASEKVINALYKFLGEPEFDPHGHPIPNLDTHDFTITQTTICDLPLNTYFRIVRVSENIALLSYLDDNNIKINDKFKVKNISKDLEIIEISNNNNSYLLNNHISKMIFVEKI